jgi:glutathione S-transferase
MKLYYAPGACSIGIHVLLEEIGKPYDAERLNIQEGSSTARVHRHQPEVQGADPPARRRLGADGVPRHRPLARRLQPGSRADAEGRGRPRARVEATDYCVATLHMQGFSRMFRPANFSPNEADHDKVKARGEEIFSKGLGVLDKALAGKEYGGGLLLLRRQRGVLRVLLVERAGSRRTCPANVAAHYERMKARPAVQRTFEQEGLAA